MKVGCWNPASFLLYVLGLQVLVCFSIVLDISFVRQVLGFLFFTFIPGYILLRVFNIKRPCLMETVLFSIGLSIAFLMLIGALMNSLGSLGLISQPLSTDPIAIVANISIALMIFFDYFRNKNFDTLKAKDFNLKLFFACLIIPILSVISILLIRYFNSNILLISLIILISVVFATVVLSSKISSKLSSYYPLILLSITLSLCFSQVLISNYVIGDDINPEFDTFVATKNSSYWDNENNSYVQQSSDNRMMSITILPTILSNLLNIEPGWIFKLVFPLFFSLVPLCLHQLYRREFGERIAFISVIFFISNYTFFTIILTNAKQMIGELFFVISFLVLFSKDLNNSRDKWVLYIFFLFGLIVSHYSMNYIFLFLIFFIWVGGKIIRKKVLTKIDASIFALTSCFTFLWWVYILQGLGPFEKVVGTIQTTLSSFISEFFSSTSRGEDIQAALGILTRPSELHYIGTFLYNVTIFFILIGFISLFIKWRKEKFDDEFFLATLISIVLLITAVVVPRFSGFLELGRLYHILLMFLSPLFVLGTKALFMPVFNLKLRKRIFDPTIEKKKTSYCLVLTLILLVAFFLFQTGVIYEVTDDPAPSSIALSGYKMGAYRGFIHESDVYSAIWLSDYGVIRDIWTFADSVSHSHVLSSYSSIDRSMILLLSNTTGRIVYGTYIRHQNIYDVDSNMSYVYLSQFNIKEESIPWDVRENIYYTFSEVPVLNRTTASINKIYSNSLSEIYYRIP